jgi:DNA-binding MarR family transcriptional regulator
MLKAGIVEKVADKADLRNNQIYITKSGRQIQAESRSTFIVFDNSLPEGFNPDKIKQLDDYLL